MTALATRRLIDATATLPPADRALVSLWTQRGLDDAALGRMTGVDAATIALRREAIVQRLSGTLGLPPDDIAGALEALATSAIGPTSTTGPVTGAEAPSAPVALPDTQAEPEPSRRLSHPRVEPETTPRRSRGRLWALVLTGLVAAIAIVAIAAGSGSSPATTHSGPAAADTTSAGATVAPSTATQASSTVAPSTASQASSTAAAGGGPPQLQPLPGGDAHASGTITVGGAGATIAVHVTGLPATGRSHYEVWLYNSIIDSAPLGALSAAGRGTFRVPPGARHYASIDVERQPAGTDSPSGASVLRSANPLR